MADPTVTVKNVLRGRWDGTQTPLSAPPEFQTGWYSRDQRLPAITVTSKNEGPIRAGETGYTATHGPTGKAMQRLSGYVLVDCVAGTREDCAGLGTNGEDLNPKQVRHELYEQAAQILVDTQQTDDLHTLAPGDGQELEDRSDETDVKVSYRMQFRASYLRDRLPNQTS